MSDRKKGGRQSKYRPEHVEEARRRCASGAIMRELAESWEITPRLLNRWREDHPELDRAIADGRAECRKRREAGGLEARRREKAQPPRYTKMVIVYVHP
ncbi:MAG TPA: hypothetical protein VIT45_12385 [Allosphingosinicella sp.]